MDIKELRIGNVIRKDNSEYIVSTIRNGQWGLDCTDLNTNEQMCVTAEFCSGIILSEMWIARLGFEGLKDYWQIAGTLFIVKGSQLYDKYFNPVGIKLIYVHQLQNLYFALTGEELILDDN